jgi:hypothetical protein
LWFGQARTFYAGGDAAQSGSVGAGKFSSLATVAEGPAILTYYCKVIPPLSNYYAVYGSLVVSLDGETHSEILGSTEWHRKRIGLSPGRHDLGWKYINSGYSSYVTNCAWLDCVTLKASSLSLSEAADNPALEWITPESGGWFGQDDVSYFDGDAIECESTSDPGRRSLTARAAGPGTVTFAWKVSSEGGYDHLEFHLNGLLKASIDGEKDWRTLSFCLGQGENILEWRYNKDEFVDAGSDCGWIDKIEISTVNISLGEAVDNTALVWETWGDSEWSGTDCRSFAGGDAAQSGEIADSQRSCLGTQVEGPGVVTFAWFASCHQRDPILFSVDGTEITRNFGYDQWKNVVHVLSPGVHALEWMFIKDDIWTAGDDTCWLDQVEFRAYTPTPTPAPSPSPYPLLESGDYNGDGSSDIAVFRQTNGFWAIRGVSSTVFGQTGDIPAAGDYAGDGTSEAAIFRPSNGLWAMSGVTRMYLGTNGDIPAPADYDGDGIADAAVFRPNGGLWAERLSSGNDMRLWWGAQDDIPVPADYDEDGWGEPAIFRPTSGLWAVYNTTRFYFGKAGDIPFARDFDGDGTIDIAVVRPRWARWMFRGVTTLYFGTEGDLPVPADYGGYGSTQLAIFRSSSAFWAIRDLTRCWFGSTNDLPVTR